jgi:hypothetical protein
MLGEIAALDDSILNLTEINWYKGTHFFCRPFIFLDGLFFNKVAIGLPDELNSYDADNVQLLKKPALIAKSKLSCFVYFIC